MEPMRRGPTVFDTNPIWQGKKKSPLKICSDRGETSFFFQSESEDVSPLNSGNGGKPILIFGRAPAT